MKYIFLLIACFLGSIASVAQTGSKISSAAVVLQIPTDSLLITTPVTRIVYQRNNKNKAVIPIKGVVPRRTTTIEARLVARAAGQGRSTSWRQLKISVSNGSFAGLLKGSGGWYNLELRAKNGKEIIASSVVKRVGIGEVFVVVGHSVAQGGEINIEGATDDRVSAVAVHEKSERNEQYLKTGDPQYLPEPQFVQATTGVAPAPFAHDSYFWSKFAELVVQKENVPVLIYNAGFGGTSLEHWAKASQGIQFEHGFVKSRIRMPYINLYNTFKKYIPLTGIRALLADHGQNDQGQKNADTILNYYRTFMHQARVDLEHPQLALVVNRQMPKGAPQVGIVQNRMSKEPYSFPGPDYNTMLKDDTTDGIHLSVSGAQKAAVMWAQALTPRFFKKSKPWLPSWQ
jgi:hypothetical protein